MKQFFIWLVGFILLTACQEEYEPVIEKDLNRSRAINETEVEAIEKDTALIKFATILSKAVYENQPLREFLKAEAAKKFDSHSDILYGEIKNSMVGTITFRNLLIQKSSLEEIAVIEKTVPRLNILVPELPMFDITLANMDCSDNEIPVATECKDGMNLYLNGKLEVVIPEGELPDFHSFVVNENKLVRVNVDNRGLYRGFVRQNVHVFDSTFVFDVPTTLSFDCKPMEIGEKALKAFSYFYKDDGSSQSRALQRDYIYYGFTPIARVGQLNHGVTEYIGFMEVEPNAYFKISDQTNVGSSSDPKLVKNSVSRKKKDFTSAELIKKMWSEGAYSFRFELYSSTAERPIVTYVSLRPEQLWDFNYDRKYLHKTWFRSSKYTYSIDVSKFTKKRVDLSSCNISFGKWDLSQEALERYVSIYEEDKAATYEYETSYDLTVMEFGKISGNFKFGLGTGGTGEVGTEFNSTTTRKIGKKFKMTRTEEDDALGTMKIYFYDPIVLERLKKTNEYVVNSYNTGVVNFGLVVK